MNFFDRFILALGRRIMIGFALMTIAAVGSCFQHGGPGGMGETFASSETQSTNPWAKNYVPPESSHQDTSSSHSHSYSYSYSSSNSDGSSSSRYSSSADAQERIKDEEFREKVVHQLRKEYERNGETWADD